MRAASCHRAGGAAMCAASGRLPRTHRLAKRLVFAAACAASILTFAPARAHAQRRARPVTCGPRDTVAAWHREQRTKLTAGSETWSNDSLRRELLAVAGVDPSRPLAIQFGAMWADSTDAATLTPDATAMGARLKTLAAQRGPGWPVRSAVGVAGIRAVWLLAVHDRTIEGGVLHRMMEAGPDESLPADVAVLEDRVRLHAGRKQLYGTQWRRSDAGMPVPLAIEDSSHVDLRRDAAGLPPLAVAACRLRTGK